MFSKDLRLDGGAVECGRFEPRHRSAMWRDHVLLNGGFSSMVWNFKCDEIVSFGDLVVDGPAWEARFRGVLVPLTKTEFAVLALLASQAHRVVPHREIVETLWGYDWSASLNASLAVHVSRVRSKLGSHGIPKSCLRTVRGVGYRLNQAAFALSGPPLASL